MRLGFPAAGLRPLLLAAGGAGRFLDLGGGGDCNNGRHRGAPISSGGRRPPRDARPCIRRGAGAWGQCGRGHPRACDRSRCPKAPASPRTTAAPHARPKDSNRPLLSWSNPPVNPSSRCTAGVLLGAATAGCAIRQTCMSQHARQQGSSLAPRAAAAAVRPAARRPCRRRCHRKAGDGAVRAIL